MKLKTLTANYRTTTTGAAGTVAGIALLVMLIAQAVTAINDGDISTNPNWEAIGAALIAVLNSLGLVRARDDQVPDREST